MFGNAIAKLPRNYGILKNLCPAAVATQRGYRLRGKPPLVAKTIEQRLQCKYYYYLRLCFWFIIYYLKFSMKKLFKIQSKFNDINPKCNGNFLFPDEAEKLKRFEDEKKAVDIGFPAARLSRAQETKLKMEHQKQLKNNPEIERLSRHLKCKLQPNDILRKRNFIWNFKPVK